MAYKKNIIRLTTVNLSKKTSDNPELNEKLWNAKTSLDSLAMEAKKARLEAEQAVANYQIVASQRAKALSSFFLIAGEADNAVAMEEGCMPPYVNDGDLCVDIPFTQREQRLAVRAGHRQLLKAAQDEDGEIDPDMFASDDEN